MRTRLTSEMIDTGLRLPWDLCNDDGLVVFRKGFSINTEASLQSMLGMKLFLAGEQSGAPDAEAAATREAALTPQTPAAPEILEPFRKIEQLADEINVCFSEISQSPGPAVDTITGLVAAARQLYAEQTSACLAAIHFQHGKLHSCTHPIYSIFLVELMAAALELDEFSHGSLSNAALTANLGMFEYHDGWTRQDGPLDEEQRKHCRQHPEVSVQRLRASGVTDNLWLKIVCQHHELADGSGYPRGLSERQIQREALILALIDRYLSFVMPRAGRTMIHPTEALKKIHEDVAAYEEELIMTFIKQIGVYPPGTSVRLINGEIAVVVAYQPGNSGQPRVVSIGCSADKLFKESVLRDTKDPAFKIKGLYRPDPARESNPALLVRSW